MSGCENEDLSLIDLVLKFEKKKKFPKHVIPPKGTPVILLFSGGIDSTVAWFILAKIYKLQVYPLSVVLSANDQDKSTILKVAQIMKSKIGEDYHEPFLINRDIRPKELQLCEKKGFHPSQVLQYFSPEYDASTYLPGVSTLVFFDAVYYKHWLSAKHNIIIDHIYLGILASDGKLIPCQTLSFITLGNLMVKYLFNDKKLLLSSVFIELGTNSLVDKQGVIKLAHEYGLQLKETRSCYKNYPLNCGECLGCRSRIHFFRLSGVLDMTLYMNQERVLKYFFSPRIFLSLTRLRLKSRVQLLLNKVRISYEKIRNTIRDDSIT